MASSPVVNFFLLLGLGYLLMWLFKKQPLSYGIARWLDKKLQIHSFVDLLDCYLCLGVWSFSVLSWLFKFTIISIGIPILEFVVTGCVMSFIGYLIFRGWESSFMNIVIGS